MKNVYLYISAWLIGLSCYGQDLQNANWYFGDHAGLNFSTGSPIELSDMPIASSFYPGYILEGCAIISDKSGNLLFYTNGIEVFSYNHQIMDNGTGLFGHQSSAQNAVIIPKPGNNKQFYVVTRDGDSGTGKGLHYSLIDMSLNSGLGKVLTKNDPLKDHLGILINPSYNYGTHQRSEKITSTFNSDGQNYWLVTQVKDYVYSYSVTSTGISLIPTHFYQVPAEHPYISGPYIKVSPDGSRIITAHNRPAGGQLCYIAGSFNNATGQISNMNINISPSGFFSPEEMEFSPDSNSLYFIANNPSSGKTSIHKYNFLNSQTEIVQNNLNFLSRSHLRLAIDGKIYIPSNNTNKISVISDPNNYANPGYSNESLIITRNSSAGLPQLVYWHDQPCDPLTLTSEPNTIFTYQQKSTILAHDNYNVSSGKDITMKARDFIVLAHDAHIASGANYWAKIENCERGGIEMRKSSAEDTSGKKTGSVDKKLTLYPNPANAFVTVTSGDGITNIIITSLDGKLMHHRDYSAKETSAEIDVRNYTEGIYMISITTAKGEVQTGKLIKN